MTLDVARHQWADGLRRLGTERGNRARQLADLVDAVQDELRRRIGQTFTLAELADAYASSEDWVRDVVVESAPPPPRAEAGLRDAALIGDAAFASYARGATDYRP